MVIEQHYYEFDGDNFTKRIRRWKVANPYKTIANSMAFENYYKRKRCIDGITRKIR